MSAWIYCKNMPGYLPDNGPELIVGHDAAKRYVVDELLADADFYAKGGDEASAEQLASMAEGVNLSGHNGWADILTPSEGADWAYSLERADGSTTLEDVAEYCDSFPPHDSADLWDIAVEYCIGDDLGTPCSAWGPRASDCAPAAAALAWIYWESSGNVPTLDQLDDCTGIVVNDESGYDVAVQILNNLHAFDDIGEYVAVDIVHDMIERDNAARDVAATILRAGELYDAETAQSIAEIIRDTF